jgi:hypothetical protein
MNYLRFIQSKMFNEHLFVSKIRDVIACGGKLSGEQQAYLVGMLDKKKKELSKLGSLILPIKNLLAIQSI